MRSLLDNETKMLASIKTDKAKEKDLTEFLNHLRSSRGLSDFVTACVRACWETPNILRRAGYSQISSDMSKQRVEFIKSTEKSVSELYEKVNGIYRVAFQMYTLSQFNKRMNLEDKSKLILAAQFELQRFIKQLETTLGIGDISNTWDSSNTKMADVTELSDKVLEYIIHTYDGITAEIVEIMQPKTITTMQPMQEQTFGSGLSDKQTMPFKTVIDGQLDNTDINTNSVVNAQESTSKYNIVDKNTELGDEQQQLAISDEADWDALGAFIGD